MNQRVVPLDRMPELGPDASGLNAAQVQAQRGHGFNDIVPHASSGWRVVLRDTLRDPMLWFLVLTAALFGLLGQIAESLTLVVAIVPLPGMDAFLHRRTAASSAGLASRLASSSRALRDGQWQEIPVVYTFFLGLGVFRLARHKALVRRAVAVENIGRISCIVSDKTGTITAGTLVLTQVRAAAGEEDDAGAHLGAEAPVHVVARTTPAQKLALVQALQAEGELVAVTGDGVNDVPALRRADVGVAMGERGTRSAREVAPMVLLDDNFRTIVDAVAEGRQLFQNLRLAFAYLLLVHLPLVVGAAAIPLMGLPLLFLPIHIVWLELVIHPTAMLAFQNLPAHGPLAPVKRQRQARFFSLEA